MLTVDPIFSFVTIRFSHFYSKQHETLNVFLFFIICKSLSCVAQEILDMDTINFISSFLNEREKIFLTLTQRVAKTVWDSIILRTTPRLQLSAKN